jgi:hypothetical protein
MMRLRRTILAVSGLAVLAACSAQSNGGSDNSGGTGGPTSTGPIQVGVLITDTATEAKRNGVSIVSPFRDAAHALIAAVNARGGMAGRKVQEVDDAIEFTAPNHDTAFQAICQKFTKDKHVQAVLYDGIIYNESFNTCLTNAKVPIVYMSGTGASPVGDDIDLKNNPGLFVVDGVSMDRRVKSIMTKALVSNYLPPGSKIGVVMEDCAYDQRVYDNTLKPIADKNHLTLVKGGVKCAHGYADNAPSLAQIQNFALKFKSEGVGSVMFVTTYENGLVYYLAQGAHTQNWTPQYLLFRQQGNPGTMKIYPPEQLTKMRGFGGIPLSELTSPAAAPPAQAAVQQKCLADARANGVAAQLLTDQITVYQVCDVVRLLQQGLVNSGGKGGTDALVPAIEKIGSSFISALDLNGVTQFGPGRHDGMELTGTSAYGAGCKCFEYTGGAASATPIQ